MGKGAQATGGPWAPTPTGRAHAKKPFLLLPSVRPEKKGSFSLREVARIRNIKT